MLKYLVAATIGIGAAVGPAIAQSPAPYDNDQIATMKREADRLSTRAADASADATPDTAPSYRAPTESCENCPPPRQYDSVEVVKNSRDVDQSRVINTQSVVNVPPRTKETNKLIVRENETRNVGVVLHNHTIIEKEIRYVKRRAHAYRVQTTYQPVCQSGELVYWIVRRGGAAAVVPAEALGYGNPCHRPCDCGTTVEAYAPRYAYRQSYNYDATPRAIHIPLHAYGAYR
jgi:hypothetical protein